MKIICAIFVIILHISSTYINAYSNKEIFIETYKSGIFILCLYYIIVRFAVPLYL